MFMVGLTFTTAACGFGSASLWSGRNKNGVKKGAQEVVKMRLIVIYDHPGLQRCKRNGEIVITCLSTG